MLVKIVPNTISELLLKGAGNQSRPGALAMRTFMVWRNPSMTFGLEGWLERNARDTLRKKWSKDWGQKLGVALRSSDWSPWWLNIREDNVDAKAKA